MNDRKRDPWRAPYVTGEYAISGMWYLPVCRGRICRNPDCDNGHFGPGAVPVFHGGSR